MKSIVKLLKRRSSYVFVGYVLAGALVNYYWGIYGSAIFFSITIIIFFGYIMYRIYPRRRELFFYNRNGLFQAYDVVYDRGSATRPNQPGILKHDLDEGWFLIYEDGFEWPMSDIKNIENFIYKKGE